MPSSFGNGTVRVTVPSSYDVAQADRSTDRDLEAGGEDPVVAAAVVRALQQSDLSLVDRVDLAPRRSKDLDRPVPNRRGTVKVDVDVPAGEDAVVLLERDGVYSWHLPVNPAARTKDLTPGPRTVRFEIEVQPRGTATGRLKDRRDRGLLGDLVHGAVQALVFRFVAPPLVEKAVELMEAHVRTGLVHLTGDKVSTWKRFETLDELDLPQDRPARVLLFVHGTFASTVGAFGALAVDENGKGFLRTAIAAYDAVIGYDHRTLSLDPRENAEDLLRRLATYRPASELVIDVVTHSRGGLTTRAFIEEVLPQSDWPGRVDVAVFVAATNNGTHLASPERWSDLVDVYTNLTAASARLLATLPGSAPVASVVSGVVKGIGALVKFLVSYAATSDDVPGLKAMIPGGEFVTELNRLQPGQPGPGTDWHVVSSNFHAELFDDHHTPAEFPRELVALLVEGFVDRLFEGDNDLVVDTASMSAIGLPDGGFVSDSLELGENDDVYHLNYFTQLPVITALGGWLPLGMGAGGGDETAAMAAPPMSMPAEAVPGDDGAVKPPGCVPSRARTLQPAPSAAAEPPAADEPSTAVEPSASGEPSAVGEPPAEPAQASVGAEMPADVVAEQDFQVRVRISRAVLQATAGAAHAEADVAVDAARELTVQLVGKRNATIAAPDTAAFDLPKRDTGSSELLFTARALGAGPVTVLAVVRQGTVPLTTLTLEATAVAEGAWAEPPLATTATASAHPGVDAPELEGLPCLDIFERVLPDQSVVYQYAVRLEPGEPPVLFESEPLQDREQRVAKILDDVAQLWRETESDPRERERKLQDIGATMFDELFPEPMQEHLWKHRARVHDLILYADEPFVPWELVHLKPPRGPRQTKARFLAQGGLVRWQLGSFPPREIRVRSGKARSLCPAYLDPRFALTEPVHEQEFLERRFGARKVTPTPAGVRDLLRSGRFDLLHFSGHGAADPDNVLNARVLLRGRKRGGDVEPQYLGSTTVSENAAWAKQGDPGPIVVLNACQVGRAGELLTTVGGFAKAFLDAGASAFVSCLWSVHEQPSRVFVERLYDELLAGEQMSVAATRAREQARKAGDASWLAFVVYARPDAVLVHG